MATDVVHGGHSTHEVSGPVPVVAGVIVLLVAYIGALVWGLPQAGTEQIVAASHHDADHHADAHGHADAAHAAAATGAAVAAGHHADHAEAAHHGSEAGHHGTEAGHHGEDHAASGAPPVYAVIPFILLLGAIAVFPLWSKTEHWWESNLNRFKFAAGLGALTLAYYGFLHHAPIEGHWPAHHVVSPADGFLQAGFVKTIFANAIFQEFIPFIVLLFSLYTICGGIRISGDLQANPMTNASFLLVGSGLASFIGTTGAAMLLIRPLLETNKERKYVVHTVVFFIFTVCNCGGCLLPIGDPPLFLGYLQGVSFTWTLQLWKEWLFVNGVLVALYLVVDQFFFYSREAVRDVQRDATQTTKLTFGGLKLNAPLLVGVVLAVAFLDPSKTLPGTAWHPWMYLREMVQLCLVAISLAWGAQKIRSDNSFNYHAIIEVAALFCGIFICMQPALQILGVYGGDLGIDTPAKFFWITGGLSSVLDNAPTYMVFFKTAQALPHAADASLMAGVETTALAAISLGAVFMGAMTYIGNGPNFMVKAIAEQSGVKMPSFFGYVMYSAAFLLPILVLSVWLFV